MTGDTLRKSPASTQSVKQMAYDMFQAALFDGRLKSGELVSQRDLVNLLHLSIGALRELLPRLESEGLITVAPKRGIQITAIDLPMIRDAFQMRAALEREAAIHAVRTLPDATLESQKQLHLGILAEIKEGVQGDVLQRGQEIDTEFHNLLIRATGNEILIQAYNINSIRIRLIKHERISLNERQLPSAFADHLAIIDAIMSRSINATIDAMDTHISNARQRAMEL